MLKNKLSKAFSHITESRDTIYGQGQTNINYSQYSMGGGEYIGYALVAILVVLITGYIFYRSLLLSLIFSPLAFMYPVIKKGEIIEKRRQELRLQFKDMLYYLSTALSVGKSIESGFNDALSALKGIYGDEKVYIVREVEVILTKIELNKPLEEILSDFANRSGIDDIKSFAKVYSICYRKGGNVIDIIGSTATVIREKIEIEQELQNIVSAKRLEKNILFVTPIALVLLLSVFEGGYLDILYTTVQGRIVMTCAILLMLLGYYISKKIMDIRV